MAGAVSRKAIFIFPLCWCVSAVQTVRENFWIYDDVTDNGFLGLAREISIHWAAFIFVPFTYPMRPHINCKGTSEEHVKQKKDGVSPQHWQKSPQCEVNGNVLETFWLEWSLNSCKFQVSNNSFCFWKNYSEKLE